ncbi:uncharacterized protein SCHCODRAFT_02623981 [Schizophyllum commune H4-8]|uniref:uncharacterized protein n=1 Tax=Schizophyllum commune (strain H4-8 / FGSC 9210) TaxID=578458 RepID=UPI00215E68C6|nr:uncharacterized protein SCHCODRAFT_02623981 [Schizophyllum commune H4-8]KAI5894192.1 hypothetical protein SCHCODRAFT_02623981 [Schizophyllum commune H4-8]
MPRLLAMWGERWGTDVLRGCLTQRMRAGGGKNETEEGYTRRGVILRRVSCSRAPPIQDVQISAQ